MASEEKLGIGANIVWYTVGEKFYSTILYLKNNFTITDCNLLFFHYSLWYQTYLLNWKKTF